MASVRKHNGSWQAVWSVTDADGRRRQRTRSFATKAEARAHADEVERLYEARGVAPPEDLTFDALIARYLDWCARRVQRTTLAGYARNLAYVARHLGPLRIRRVTAKHLDDAYAALAASGGKNARPLSPQTVRHIHRAAHHLFRQAERWNLIADNPARLAEPVKVPHKRAQPYTLAQVQAAVAVAGDSPWPELVCLLAGTGLRRGEALGLSWAALDLDLDDGWLEVRQVVEQAGDYYGLRPMPKTKSSARRIALDAGLCAMLQAWRATLAEQVLALGLRWSPDALVFPDLATGSTAAPLRPNTVSGRLRNIARRAGVPAGVAGIHGLRHAHATALMALPVRQVADRLGHSRPTVTMNLYQHTDQNAARATAQTAAAAFGPAVALVRTGAKTVQKRNRL
jgi:integrase